jgi:tetratricopeptide (TPR) repeat protein
MVCKATTVSLAAWALLWIPVRLIAQDAIDQLSENQYSRRHQATLEMWRHREESRQQVQQAAEHPDPEVAGRARWILRQWSRGWLPDTPPEISRLLQRSDGPVAIQPLLESGQFTALMVAIEESDGTPQRMEICSRISEAMLQRFPFYIRQALEQDSLSNLLRLIELAANSPELAVCRIELMRQLGIEVGDAGLLPASAADWSPIERQRATAMVLMALGRLDDAVRLAAAGADTEFLYQCQMVAGHWAEAAEDSVRLARDAEPGSLDQTRWWCRTLIAADRSDDEGLFAEAVQTLTSIPTPEMGEELDPASDLRWKCLVSHGQVDAALAILDKVSPESSSAVAIDAARTGRTFAALGFPLDRLGVELTSWIDQSIAAQLALEGRVSPEIYRILALMCCLIDVGRDREAWQIAHRLSRSEVKIGSLPLREYVVSMLTITKRSDWVLQLAVGEGDQVVSPQSLSSIVNTLSAADESTLETILDAMSEVLPSEPLNRRLRAACQLLEGEIPDGFDPALHFEQLFRFVLQPQPNRSLRSREPGAQPIRATENVAGMFARHGQHDLALACLQKLAQTGDVAALFALAEQALDSGRVESALPLFQTVFKSVALQRRFPGATAASDDTALAVKALIGSWIVARRSGDEQWSSELQREIRLTLCTPNTDLRRSVAQFLGERGEESWAIEIFEALMPRMAITVGEHTGLYDAARGYSMLARKSKPGEAARWFDLAVSGTPEAVNFRPGAYVTLPLYVQRWAIESAIASKDLKRTRKHLQRILVLDPLDIDFAERLLPEMRAAGMNELADAALDQILDNGIAYVTAFPFDPMSSNNLAWVAAINHRRLDDALRLSEQAVFHEPDSAIYRDTLAEVLFQLGRKQEALLVEQACLLDDPGQWHLHEQVEKYTEAIASDSP